MDTTTVTVQRCVANGCQHRNLATCVRELVEVLPDYQPAERYRSKWALQWKDMLDKGKVKPRVSPRT